MFSNIKLTVRSLRKNKAVTSLNILGLTISLLVSILIFLFVINQSSMDRFIPDVDNVFCLTNNGETYFSQNEINLIKDNVSDIDKITYCSQDWSPQVFLRFGEDSYKTEKMLTADSCFFRVFAFDAVYGNPAEALNTSNKVVLTRSFSEKIFGKENPVGKTLIYNSTILQGELLEVTAVIEDLPSTSSWDFNAVLSFQTNYKIDWYVSNMKDWGTRNYMSFVKINKALKQKQVVAKLNNIPMKDVPEWIQGNLALNLFPFSKVYFDLPKISLTKHGNRLTVSIIKITGILILLLGCVNYVNMIAAQRATRNKNIGIVKILGGNRNRIIQMITVESFIQVLLAGLLAIILISLVFPAFINLTSIKISTSEILNFKNSFLLLAIFFVMIVVTGVMPGLLFSKSTPFVLMKRMGKAGGINFLRNSFLVFQFIVTIALIISMLIVNRQNSYLKNKELGFSKSSIIYAFTNDALADNAQAFKDEVRRIPGISDLTYSENILIDNGGNWGRDIINKGEKENIYFSKLSVAPNFFQFFGINLREGRSFNENSKRKQEFIFNATAQKQFRLDNLDKARIATPKPENGSVTGIIEDYNFESFHVPIRAAGFMCSGDFDDVIYLKLNGLSPADFKRIMNQFETIWNKFSPDFPLETQYLDKTWEVKYSKEERFQKIIFYTTLISILLSCIGLIGVTYFVMEQRIKEIGIRKVNGAKVLEVLVMLNKGFMKWVAIAFLIASPIAYYAMNKWLDNFAYKTSLSWWIFALSGVLALGIVFLTVSWQSWRAATRNPVEALRYE